MNVGIAGEGENRIFFIWIDCDQVFDQGSVSLSNSSGSVNAQDNKSILSICPGTASGLMFPIAIVPESLGNFVLMVNGIPGSLESLHSLCRNHGLDTSYVHYPLYEPILTANKDSIVIPLAGQWPSHSNTALPSGVDKWTTSSLIFLTL